MKGVLHPGAANASPNRSSNEKYSRVSVRLAAGVLRKTFTLEDLRKLPEDIIIEFLGICYECGEPLTHSEEGFLACTSCGREYNDGGEIESRIPISEESSADGHSESHWSPQSMIAFAKGLGTNDRITNPAMCRIIAATSHDGHAVCPSCQKELPSELGLRATQTRILTNKVDHPDIQNMLSFASRLCNDYGMHNRSLSSVVFAEDLGRWVRALGTTCILRNDPSENRRNLVRATFYMLFNQYFPGQADKIHAELKLKSEDVDYVEFLIKQYRLREKHNSRSPKAMKELFTVGFGLLQQHGLTSDDGFCQEYSKLLLQAGLSMLVHGYTHKELVAKAIMVLTSEEVQGREKATKLMSKVGVSERLLGQVETLSGQKPAFSK